MDDTLSRDIPLCIPEIQGNEWQYLKECLDTGWVSSVGSFVDRFEQMVAQYTGAGHAAATVNGTAALHVALRLAGVKQDDEVLVSTLSFIAPANAIRYQGAWPIFIDAEPVHWQMDPQRVNQFLEQECEQRQGELVNKSTGRTVRAILPVHILGHPVDLAPITKFAERFGLVVVEDAAESLGARYREQMVGTVGAIGCFSFNGNKLITTGGGGMLVTNREDLAAKARYLVSQAKNDPLEYVHEETGYNYRLTNIQAALGCAQMEKISEYLSRKKAIAERYNEAFSKVESLQIMQEASWASSSFWLYTVLVNDSHPGATSRSLLRSLRDKGIITRPLWQPLHCSPAHRDCQRVGGQVAEDLNRRALSLPCSVGLTDEQQNRVIDEVLAALT